MSEKDRNLSEFIERAKKYFYDGYTWSGAVVQVAQEYLGEVDERITRMATVLPGGLNLRGGTCGILLGALAAVGLKCGSIIREDRKVCGKLGLRVHDFFQELTSKEFGTIDCRDISCCDFTNPEEAKAYIGSKGQDRCAMLLTDTVRFVLPALDDPEGNN